MRALLLVPLLAGAAAAGGDLWGCGSYAPLDNSCDAGPFPLRTGALVGEATASRLVMTLAQSSGSATWTCDVVAGGVASECALGQEGRLRMGASTLLRCRMDGYGGDPLLDPAGPWGCRFAAD